METALYRTFLLFLFSEEGFFSRTFSTVFAIKYFFFCISCTVLFISLSIALNYRSGLLNSLQLVVFMNLWIIVLLSYMLYFDFNCFLNVFSIIDTYGGQGAYSYLVMPTSSFCSYTAERSRCSSIYWIALFLRSRFSMFFMKSFCFIEYQILFHTFPQS